MPSDENITKKYLHEWFLENDNLVIPDLGRFEASYLGAKLHPAAHKALPPNKTLFFDPNQKEDDQVLANYIAEQENISLSEAQKTIKLFVTTVKAELGIQKKYLIENLGTFVWSPGGSISFQPDEESNYLGDSFGLPDLYNLKPGNYVTQETPSNAFESNFNTVVSDTRADENDMDAAMFDSAYADMSKDYVEEPADEPATNSRGRLFTVSAIILLLLSVATTYFLYTDQNLLGLFSKNNDETIESDDQESETPLNEDTQLFEFEGDEMVEADVSSSNSDEESNANTEKDDNTTNDEPIEEESPRNNNTTEDYSNYDGSAVVDYATNDSFIGSFAYNPNPPANLNSIMVNQPNSRFYVVLGSFKEQANAYSFYNNLVSRGVRTAKIISPSGRNTFYRVSCQDYSSLKEAETEGKAFGKQRNLFVLIYPY